MDRKHVLNLLTAASGQTDQQAVNVGKNALLIGKEQSSRHAPTAYSRRLLPWTFLRTAKAQLLARRFGAAPP
jgi:hypothetical protein